MIVLPYPTWDKYPSPKQVYAAFGHTYVGYLPSFQGLMRLEQTSRSSTYLTNASSLAVCRFADFVNITSLDMRISNLRYTGYVCDSNSTYTETHQVTHQYVTHKQPRYQMLLFDTVLAYPKGSDRRSFYVFEDFIINDSTDILLWAKYAKRASWSALKALEALPERY